jgi:hypothetical protein
VCVCIYIMYCLSRVLRRPQKTATWCLLQRAGRRGNRVDMRQTRRQLPQRLEGAQILMLYHLLGAGRLSTHTPLRAFSRPPDHHDTTDNCGGRASAHTPPHRLCLRLFLMLTCTIAIPNNKFRLPLIALQGQWFSPNGLNAKI